MSHHSELFYKKIDEYYSNQNKRKPWTVAEVKEIVADILLAKQTPGKKTRRQYYLLSLYDVLEIGNKQIVIKKQKNSEDNHISIVCYEDLFDVLHNIHISVGHGGRDKMIHALQTKFDVARYAVEKFIETCEVCQKKRNKSHVNSTIKPIILTNFNSRGQVELVDFQSCPDDDYKWMLNYQDQLTKFIFLRPLKAKTSYEVAKELLKIFLEIGAPSILQSDNGFEFTNSLISELVKMWPTLKLLHVDEHPQPQESTQGTNEDVENMLRAWMHDHNSINWSLGCYFVQFQKNSSYHTVIGRTPYKALFGVDPKVGLSSENLPRDLLDRIENEDDLGHFMEIPEEENEYLEEIDSNNDKNVKESEHPCVIKKELFTDDYQESTTDVIDPISEKSNNQCTCPESGGKCVLCRNETSIDSRSDPGQGHKRKVEEMVSNIAEKLARLEIGSCVILPVDKIVVQNLVCVVTDYKNGVYEIGCSAGRIKSWFSRSDLIRANKQLLMVDNIPHNFLTKREVMQSLSLAGE